MTALAALIAMGSNVLPLAERHVADLVSFDRDRAKASTPYLGMEAETDPERAQAAREAVGRAMRRYPALALSRRLDHVYLLQEMWLAKAFVGGAGSRDRRSVLAVAKTARTNPAWLERTFHHELAHLLQDQASFLFPKKAWRAANPPGWTYPFERGDNERYLSDPYYVREDYVPALHERGFLSPYGSTSDVEDWGTYAEGLLADDPDFWNAVRRFPRVRAKARLVVRFYRAFLPGIVLPDVPDETGRVEG